MQRNSEPSKAAVREVAHAE
jgi:hypothetical protein